MPETVSPTRMNLLQRKQQAQIAGQGVDLLKRKRDALVADFFNIVRQSLVARERLTKDCHVMAEQIRALDRSRISDGPLTKLTAEEMLLLERSLMGVLGML